MSSLLRLEGKVSFNQECLIHAPFNSSDVQASQLGSTRCSNAPCCSKGKIKFFALGSFTLFLSPLQRLLLVEENLKKGEKKTKEEKQGWAGGYSVPIPFPAFPVYLIFYSLQSPLISIEKRNQKCHKGLYGGESTYH